MAKRMRKGGRVISHHNLNANVHRVARPTVLTFTLPQPTTILGDRRQFRMDGRIAPPHAVNRNATRLVVDNFGKSIRRQTLAPIRFKVPEKVSLCVRRKTRKEVIHAKGIAGTRTRRPRRNEWSSIKC